MTGFAVVVDDDVVVLRVWGGLQRAISIVYVRFVRCSPAHAMVAVWYLVPFFQRASPRSIPCTYLVPLDSFVFWSLSEDSAHGCFRGAVYNVA